MYLLDSNVVSETRKIETTRRNAAVESWVESVSEDSIYLSSIVVLELQFGIALLRQKDPAQSELLRKWLHHRVLPSFAGRILPVDTGVALRCADLHVPITRSR
jgi:predicted nucleic acid-binding protein